MAVIITGAGSGLGRALAIALARRGHCLALVGRSDDSLRETRRLCAEEAADGHDAHVVAADLKELSASEAVVAQTLKRFGEIAALVNNAAEASFGRIEDDTPEAWRAMLEVNLLAPMMLIKLAVPSLRESRGSIINISSIGGVLALPGRAAYGASKAALAHLTRSLAKELAPEIRVNAIVPGAIDTPMYDKLGLDAEEVEAFREQLVATTPLGRMGTAEDVVPWVELLLSEGGQWVTGSLIVVDGGRSC